MLGALADFFSNHTRYKSSFDDYQKLISKDEKGESQINRQDFEELLNKDPRLLDHYTPNPFASLIARSISRPPDKVLDPCCGLANILHCLSFIAPDAEMTGIEINKGVSILAKYLVPESKIINSDFFQFNPDNKFDLIVGTIPTGQRVKLGGRKIKIDDAFIFRSVDLLEDGGEAFFIVSYDFISNSDQVGKKEILPYLNSIIRLPKLKNSNSNLKKYLIHLTKNTSEKISFGSIKEMSELKLTLDEHLKTSVYKSQLEDQLQPEFYISRESDKYDFLNKFKSENLEDFAKIIRGAYIKQEEKKTRGKFLF